MTEKKETEFHETIKYLENWSQLLNQLSAEDSKYCKDCETNLHKALDNLEYWYKLFKKEADRLKAKGDYKVKYQPDGTVWATTDYESKPYETTLFRPFSPMNDIVKKYNACINSFISHIIDHFNNTYNLNMPLPEWKNEHEFNIAFRPVYSTYFELLAKYLDGKTFYQKAEEELILRVRQNIKKRYSGDTRPQLKGSTIILPDFAVISDYKPYCIYSPYVTLISSLCAGILFICKNQFKGDISIIENFNTNNIDVTSPYMLPACPEVQIKIYKNRRLDIKFSHKEKAEQFFYKFKLNQL